MAAPIGLSPIEGGSFLGTIIRASVDTGRKPISAPSPGPEHCQAGWSWNPEYPRPPVQLALLGLAGAQHSHKHSAAPEPWQEENCSAGGGGVTRRPIFPTHPPPSLAAVMGGGVQGGGARPAVPGGGGGVNPTSMAQNDTHVALIILTTQMWGGKLLVEKTFSGQILCSCAFGANIHSYTKQRARHGTPFLQPPPLLRRASMSPPPPPPRRAIFRSPRARWSPQKKKDGTTSGRSRELPVRPGHASFLPRRARQGVGWGFRQSIR